MLRSLAGCIFPRCSVMYGRAACIRQVPTTYHITKPPGTTDTKMVSFSGKTIAPPISVNPSVDWNPVSPEDMPYLHHGKRPRYREYTKFKSPRRRASALYTQLQNEAIQKSITSKPKVWNTQFQVGDAIEIENVEEGGVNAKTTEKIRGVVLGIFRKRLDHSVLIRDVVFGEPVETKVPLHSPLVRSIKILEKNFVHKGKKKIKRAKLYYLSERNPLGTFVPSFLIRLVGYINYIRIHVVMMIGLCV